MWHWMGLWAVTFWILGAIPWSEEVWSYSGEGPCAEYRGTIPITSCEQYLIIQCEVNDVTGEQVGCN